MFVFNFKMVGGGQNMIDIKFGGGGTDGNSRQFPSRPVTHRRVF